MEKNGFERSVPRQIGNGFAGSSELGPIYRRTGHPSSCWSRHTNRVVGRRSAEPQLGDRHEDEEQTPTRWRRSYAVSKGDRKG